MKFWLLSAILVVTSSAVCQSQRERINIGLVGNTKVLEDGKPVIEIGGEPKPAYIRSYLSPSIP